MFTKIIRVSVFHLCISSLFFGSSVTVATESVNRPYENALKSFYIEDLNAAVIYLKNALKNNPAHLPSRILMAEILIAKGDGIGAEVELKIAQRGKADNKRVLPLLLEAYLLQDKFDQVITDAKEIKGNKRLTSDIFVFKARALFSKNNTRLAQVEFNKALTFNPRNPVAMLGLAQISYKRNQYQTALELIEQALAVSPINTNALQMKANIFQIQGKVVQAESAISEAIAINNKHFPALLTRAGIYIEQEKFAQALMDVDMILADIPNEPRANYLKTVITQALGQVDEMEKTASHLSMILMGLPQDIMRENPIYYYLAGLVNFNQNNILKAQEVLRKYIDIVPNDVRALKLIAKVELSLNEAFSAKNHLIKARLVDAKDVEIWTLLGQSYLATGDMEKAQRYFIDVVEALPKNANALLDLANLQMLSGQFQLAIKSLFRAKSLKNSLEINYMLVQAYQANKELVNALNLINELLEENSDLSYLHQHQGMLLGLTGKHQQARAAFEQSVKLSPNNLDSVIHLARIDVIEGDIVLARSRLQEKLVDFADSAPLLVELGNTYTKQSEINQAKGYYEKAYSLSRNSSLALLKVIEVLSVQQETAQAITLIEDYLARNNKNAKVYLHAAKLYLLANKHELAISAHQLSVKHANNKGEMLIAFAQSQMQIGDTDGAILSYQRALGWNDYLFGAYHQLINLLAKKQQPKKAIKYIELLEQKTKNTALTSALMADVYWFNNQFAKAITFYKKSLQLEKSKKATFGLYRVYMRQKAFDLAEVTLKTWLEIHNDDLAMLIALADIYIVTERTKQAAKLYDELIAQFGMLPILLNNAAQANIVLNNLAKAQGYAEKALAAAPNLPAVMDTLAWVYTKLNKLEEALALYREALAIDSESAELQYHLAVTLHKMGRKAEALQYLELSVYSEQEFVELFDAKALLSQLKK